MCMCAVHGKYSYMHTCCPWKNLIPLVHSLSYVDPKRLLPVKILPRCSPSKTRAVPDYFFFYKKNLPHFHLRTLLQIPYRMLDIVKKFHPISSTLAPLISHPARGSLSHPKTHSKGVTVISHLKSEGLKYNLTQTIIL